MVGAISASDPIATQPPMMATISANIPIDFHRPRVRSGDVVKYPRSTSSS